VWSQLVCGILMIFRRVLSSYFMPTDTLTSGMRPTRLTPGVSLTQFRILPPYKIPYYLAYKTPLNEGSLVVLLQKSINDFPKYLTPSVRRRVTPG
jgi:hypothetical protein